MNKLLSKFGRYSLLFHFMIWFLIVSQILRLSFFIWQYDEVSWNIIDIIRTVFTGLFFDIGTITFISMAGIFYYTIMPNRFIGTLLDKILICLFTALTTFILVFTFFAELTFWDEFKTRFNFIAVDYAFYFQFK